MNLTVKFIVLGMFDAVVGHGKVTIPAYQNAVDKERH